MRVERQRTSRGSYAPHGGTIVLDRPSYVGRAAGRPRQVCVAPLWAGTPLTPADADKWRENLRYFAAEAPGTHKDLYHALPRELVIVELTRLVAAIGDGHTYVILWSPETKFRSLPVRFYLFRDGLHVIAAKSEHAAIVGGKVTRIGGRTAEEAMATVRDLVSHDNESGVREYLPVFLSMPEALEALGITDSAGRVPVTVLKDGKEIQAELTADASLAARHPGQPRRSDPQLREIPVDEPEER